MAAKLNTFVPLSLINIQRIRYTSFLTTGVVDGLEYKDNPFGLGGELNFDVNFFRQPSVFDLGVRWSYLPINNKPVFDLLVSNITF